MRAVTLTLAVVLALVGAVLGQGGDIQRGVIQKLDVDGKTITLLVGKEAQTFGLLETTQVLGAQGKTLAEKLQGFKSGAKVMFKADKKDGKDVLVGIKLDDQQPGKLVSGDTSKLVPLTELGTGKYQGFEGGLYPGGKNERPKEHEAAGLKVAKNVVPRDADGKPNENGKIVLLSIGMSNTTQMSQGFIKHLAKETDKNPLMTFVDGAQGGQTAVVIQNPDDGGRGETFWAVVDQRLQKSKVTRAQVQAVWIKQADAGPKEGFPAYAKKLQGELLKIVHVLHARFPNLKMIYLSSRTYGGYATTTLNPEPYAYESGFSVKWLIEQQIQGDAALNFDPARGAVKAPWLSWGPYLWANGTTKRKDGFWYEATDFSGDGTHHSPAGQEKVGRLLLEFFKSDTTSRGWFGKG